MVDRIPVVSGIGMNNHINLWNELTRNELSLYYTDYMGPWQPQRFPEGVQSWRRMMRDRRETPSRSERMQHLCDYFLRTLREMPLYTGDYGFATTQALYKKSYAWVRNLRSKHRFSRRIYDHPMWETTLREIGILFRQRVRRYNEERVRMIPPWIQTYGLDRME